MGRPPLPKNIVPAQNIAPRQYKSHLKILAPFSILFLQLSNSPLKSIATQKAPNTQHPFSVFRPPFSVLLILNPQYLFHPFSVLPPPFSGFRPPFSRLLSPKTLHSPTPTTFTLSIKSILGKFFFQISVIDQTVV